jgi:hypothetical protein
MPLVLVLVRGVLVIAASGVALLLVTPVIVVVAAWSVIAHCGQRLAAIQKSERLRRSVKEVLRPDPELGWVMQPNLDCYFTPYGVDGFHIRTCADGWPGTRRISDSDVLVVGDSFAAGNGVDAERTYYGLRSSDVRIKAVGCTGYSLVQGSILIKRLANGGINGKLVVWLVCSGNDFADSFAPNLDDRSQPFIARAREAGSWTIVDQHMRETGHAWIASYNRFRTQKAMVSAVADYYRLGYPLERACAAFEYLVGTSASAIRRAGGELIVFSVPYAPVFLPRFLLRRMLASYGVSYDDLDLTSLDRRLRSICDRARVEYYSGLEIMGFFDYLQVGEDHWNEQGHRRFHRWIVKQYQKFSTKLGGSVHGCDARRL